jgi:hypothetical protein
LSGLRECVEWDVERHHRCRHDCQARAVCALHDFQYAPDTDDDGGLLNDDKREHSRGYRKKNGDQIEKERVARRDDGIHRRRAQYPALTKGIRHIRVVQASLSQNVKDGGDARRDQRDSSRSPESMRRSGGTGVCPVAEIARRHGTVKGRIDTRQSGADAHISAPDLR